MDRCLDLAVERARDCDTLALTAGQLYAALTHMRIVAAASFPVLQFPDEFVGMRHLRGRNDVSLVPIGTPVTNVVANRTMQQRCILRDH